MCAGVVNGVPVGNKLEDALKSFVIYHLIVAVLIVTGLVVSYRTEPLIAAPFEPETCTHVATADSIKIYYCKDIYLFVNQLGFMAFEP